MYEINCADVRSGQKTSPSSASTHHCRLSDCAVADHDDFDVLLHLLKDKTVREGKKKTVFGLLLMRLRLGASADWGNASTASRPSDARRCLAQPRHRQSSPQPRESKKHKLKTTDLLSVRPLAT